MWRIMIDKTQVSVPYKNCFLTSKKGEELSVFCLQNGTRFGKSQLLNGGKLANQNKTKIYSNMEDSNLLSFDNAKWNLVTMASGYAYVLKPGFAHTQKKVKRLSVI